MKKLILLTGCLLVLATTNAQTFAWAAKAGSTGSDVCRDIATDAAGNVYSTGTFTGTVDFDPGAGTTNLVSAGGNDIFISKLDAAGALVWAVSIGNASSEEANGIALDASGNIYLTGGFYGTVDFDPGPGVVNSGNMTGMDIFVLKLSNAAGYIWYKQFGGTNDNQVGNKIAVDAAGNVYSTGQSIGVIDFDPGPGTANLGVAFSGNTNFYVSKLDASGNYVWAKVMGNANSSAYGMDIVVSSTQEVYTCGYFIATSLDFDPGAGTVSLSTGSAYDGFVHKFTSAGLYSWVRRIGGGNTPDACYSLTMDAYGIYTTGYFYATADLDPGAGTVNHTSAGLTDIFVQKMDWGGIYLWSKSMGGTGEDYGQGITVDVAGGVYTTGFFTGAVDFDPNAGTQTLTAVNQRDAFISKLNPSGLTNALYAWGYQLGCTGIESGLGIAVNAMGDVYTGGYFAGAGDFDPTAGTFNMTPAGSNDIFIQKMTQCIVPVAPANATVPANPFICYNTSVTLSVSGVGTIGWYSAATGGTYLGSGSTYNTGNLTANTTFYAQDSLCAASGSRRTINVTVLPLLTSSLSAQTNITCNGGSNGSATVAPSGGTSPFTYAWTPSGGTAATATGLAAGTYTCTITDAGGCVTTQTVSITQPGVLSASTSAQTNISCNGGSNGSATIAVTGGTGPFTYSWTPSGGTAATASGLSPANYTCTITDANACSTTHTVAITQPTVLTSSVSSQTAVSCNGGSNGSATILAGGGTPAYSYSWAPSGGTAATASGLNSGTYTCTITDANSCTRTQTVTITQPTAITSSVSSQTAVSCNGGTNGSATVAVSGGTGSFTYSWSPSGGTAATASGLTATNYTCTITDANSCTHTQTVSITQPTAVNASASTQANVSCFGGADGSASATASGGTGTFSYAWSPSGGNAANASGLSQGNYTVTVTDQNGCTATQTITVSEPPQFIANVSAITNPMCFGGNDGGATMSVSGGTGSNTFSWSPFGGNAASANNLTAGTYTCTITDANACTTTQTVTITAPTAISISTASQTDVTCNAGNDGNATVAVSGGTGAYTYLWNPSGGTLATESGLTAGTYTCTVTDANSCSQIYTVTITEPAAIDTAIIVTSSMIIAQQSGATYQWIDCNNSNLPIAGETNQTYSPVINGNYAVIITVGSCSDTSTCSSFTTGIATNEMQSFSVYPNPTSGNITIQTNLFDANETILVFNSLGQLVLNVKPTGTKTEIQLPEEAGIYLIRLHSEKNTTGIRVIKN